MATRRVTTPSPPADATADPPGRNGDDQDEKRRVIQQRHQMPHGALNADAGHQQQNRGTQQDR